MLTCQQTWDWSLEKYAYTDSWAPSSMYDSGIVSFFLQFPHAKTLKPTAKPSGENLKQNILIASFSSSAVPWQQQWNVWSRLPPFEQRLIICQWKGDKEIPHAFFDLFIYFYLIAERYREEKKKRRSATWERCSVTICNMSVTTCFNYPHICMSVSRCEAFGNICASQSYKLWNLQ